MPEQVFSDATQQLLVRLSESELAYVPAGAGGWKCRLDDIGYTSSTVSTRGVEEVRLHAADGRVATVIPAFEQIGKFYVALVRQLIARPFCDPVRESLPEQVPLLERVVWLGAQTRETDGCWEALWVDERGVVVATATGLLALPAGAQQATRVPWEAIGGVRSRVASPFVEADVLRFYLADSHLDVPVPAPHDDIMAIWAGHRPAEGAPRPAYEVAGVRCMDEAVAMSFSWEIEAARDDGFFRPDETVIACAFGLSRRTLRTADIPGDAQVLRETVDTALGGPVITTSPMKTELFLTDRRLFQVDRAPVTRQGTLVAEIALDRWPRVRSTGAVLCVEEFELTTDERQPIDMGEEFMRRYRTLATERLDPFGPGPAETVEDQLAERVRDLEAQYAAGRISADEYRTRKTVLQKLL
jgi:hypothetical protein